LNFTDLEFYFERTTVNTVVGTALLLGADAYGLWLIGCSALRIKLRRTGFEVCGLLSKQAHEYKDAKFILRETMESSLGAGVFRAASRRGGYVLVWVCHVVIEGRLKPLIWKSSHYAQLRGKIESLTASLTDVN
jgi:hypothetical protein